MKEFQEFSGSAFPEDAKTRRQVDTTPPAPGDRGGGPTPHPLVLGPTVTGRVAHPRGTAARGRAGGRRSYRYDPR